MCLFLGRETGPTATMPGTASGDIVSWGRALKSLQYNKSGSEAFNASVRPHGIHAGNLLRGQHEEATKQQIAELLPIS